MTLQNVCLVNICSGRFFWDVVGQLTVKIGRPNHMVK